MSTRLLLVCLAASTGIVITPAVRADDDERRPRTVSCPAGHAVQSVSINDRIVVQCVPVPDTSALQGAINAEGAARLAADTAETAARQAADTNLQNGLGEEKNARISGDNDLHGRINIEAVSRMQAVEELRQLIGSGGGGNGGGGTAIVDCGTGGTIGQALAAGAAKIIVRGTCHETVTISRDDVTVQGDPASGGMIQGPDPNSNVVTVRGHRVTLEGLTIRNGRNGITAIGASNLTVRGVTVESAGRNGIAFAFGSNGTIDGCTSRLNTRDGIVLDGAYARIINCTVSENTRNGILVVNGGNATMGFTDRFEAAPNVIRQNGLVGVSVALGSVATVAMSQITNNGSANNAPGVRFPMPRQSSPAETTSATTPARGFPSPLPRSSSAIRDRASRR